MNKLVFSESRFDKFQFVYKIAPGLLVRKIGTIMHNSPYNKMSAVIMIIIKKVMLMI